MGQVKISKSNMRDDKNNDNWINHIILILMMNKIMDINLNFFTFGKPVFLLPDKLLLSIKRIILIAIVGRLPRAITKHILFKSAELDCNIYSTKKIKKNSFCVPRH